MQKCVWMFELRQRLNGLINVIEALHVAGL